MARILPVEEWPGLDRIAWEAACRQESPLDPPGRAVAWSDATQSIARATWGRFLTFLVCTDDLDQAEAPDQRLTRERCAGFITSLRQRLASSTVDTTIVFLAQVAAALSPSGDWGWVRRHPLRPKPAEVRESRKPKAAPDPVRLLAAALDYCDDADADEPTAEQANRFRDGVLVAFVVSVAVRRRNIAETQLGTNLTLTDHGARLHYPRTKTGEVFDVQLGPLLVDVLRRYI